MNKANTTLYIPSRERARWLMGRKHSTLKNTFSLGPKLYVRTDDSQRKVYLDYAHMYDTEVEWQTPQALGAAQTYDELIDDAILHGYTYLIILDDDLAFSMPNPIRSAKPDFTFVPQNRLQTMFKHICFLLCEQMPMFTLTPVLSRTQSHLIHFCNGIGWAYFFYLPHFQEYSKYRFWKGKKIEARCDLNLALNLLTNGFLTAAYSPLIIPNPVNNPGGCSTYRTIELERASVDYIKKHYPKVVRTKPKRGWVGDANVIREAPIISWKKAFDKTMFYTRFKINAEDFARDVLERYEKVYSEFIDNIRSRHAENSS